MPLYFEIFEIQGTVFIYCVLFVSSLIVGTARFKYIILVHCYLLLNFSVLHYELIERISDWAISKNVLLGMYDTILI
jgi:hypothetical protein